jgi:hypothetical protein
VIEDTVAYPAMLALTLCLCEEMAASELPDPCFCGVLPGAEVAMDYCGDCGDGKCGAAWVRLVSEYPSQTFPQPLDGLAQSGGCAVPSAIQLEMGIVRCAPTGETVGTGDASVYYPPTVQEQLNAARLQTADKAAMRRAIACCLATKPDGSRREYILGAYTPIGGGDCLGGVWLATFQSFGREDEWPEVGS